MAISGNWRNSQQRQAGALKWGTGINPVHSVEDSTGRNIATEGTNNLISVDLIEPYMDADFADYEQGHETPQESGTVDHPDLGTPTELFRSHAGNFPEWGPYVDGIPGGTEIRSEDHGASLGNTPNQTPTETVSEGWLNKQTGEVDVSTVSAVAQIFRQTSGQQLRRARSGSQRGDGSASEFVQPIETRVPGQKVLTFSTGERNYDMQPREQLPRIRGWWSRTAGTGYPQWMEANAHQAVQPRTRQIPPEPNTGPPVLAAPDYGYQDEDMNYAY